LLLTASSTRAKIQTRHSSVRRTCMRMTVFLSGHCLLRMSMVVCVFPTCAFLHFFFFKQKTAYEIGTGDWSSDVCSSGQYGLNDFSPRNQDLGAVALLAQNGALGDILKGDMTGAVRKSGRTWASLPTAPASYSQPTKSWKTVNKFLGGDYQPSQQQPQTDPRLSMSAPDLLATLRKGKGKRSDNEIFMELANNNGLAGREVNYLISKGANLSDIAKDLGLNVSIAQQEPEYDLPDIGGSYDEFMANINTARHE